MAKVAVHDPLSTNSFPFAGGASMVQADTAMKRKTPSELRGEQLKRRNCKIPMDESVTSLLGAERNSSGMVRGLKKPEFLKNPKYIDTRVDDVYPVKKSSDRFRILYGKEKAKDTFPSSEQTNTLRNFSTASNLAANNKSQFSSGKSRSPSISEISAACVKDNMEQSTQNIEKCNHNTFRSVAELSLGSEMSSDMGNIDMDKALKGMFARELQGISRSPADSPGRFGDLPFNSPGNFCSEFNIPGHNTPLDLTLKTTMRLVSSSSVTWCHRLSTSSAYNGITQFTSQFGSTPHDSGGHSSRVTPTAKVLYTRALHSWAYPQSSLPPSIITAMTLSVARRETDFLLKRQLAWEDSFRCLYYMLRKNMCNIFYFYTPQFVVLFIGSDFSGKRKRSCHAYLSQSTRGLRSLLRENDICFSMPLCRSQVEEATAEDLVELSEIKRNLGQTRRLDSMSEVDNSPQSLLAFTGNESVHGLYDFLINYRSFLSSLTGVDVPVLYSPVPFQNACLCVPEVRCKEMKRADAILHTPRKSHMENGEGIQDSSPSICYSIEIKDDIIPPWIVCGICAAMGSEGKSFEASFTTEPSSIGLNIALDAVCQKSDSRKDSDNSSLESDNPLGISEAVAASCLRSASLKGLKYSDGSVEASLSPV